MIPDPRSACMACMWCRMRGVVHRRVLSATCITNRTEPVCSSRTTRTLLPTLVEKHPIQPHVTRTRKQSFRLKLSSCAQHSLFTYYHGETKSFSGPGSGCCCCCHWASRTSSGYVPVRAPHSLLLLVHPVFFTWCTTENQTGWRVIVFLSLRSFSLIVIFCNNHMFTRTQIWITHWKYLFLIFI